jgi:hypothetical protein
MPPVPGVARLAWLLFMQPIRLHHLFAKWELHGDPPLLRLLPRLRERDPVVMELLRRCAVMLLCAPIVVATIAGLLALLGLHIRWSTVALTVGMGVVISLGLMVVEGVARGLAAGLVLVVLGVVLAGMLDVAKGVALAVVLSVGFSVGFSVVGGVVVGVVRGVGGGAGLIQSRSFAMT